MIPRVKRPLPPRLQEALDCSVPIPARACARFATARPSPCPLGASCGSGPRRAPGPRLATCGHFHRRAGARTGTWGPSAPSRGSGRPRRGGPRTGRDWWRPWVPRPRTRAGGARSPANPLDLAVRPRAGDLGPAMAHPCPFSSASKAATQHPLPSVSRMSRSQCSPRARLLRPRTAIFTEPPMQSVRCAHGGGRVRDFGIILTPMSPGGSLYACMRATRGLEAYTLRGPPAYFNRRGAASTA